MVFNNSYGQTCTGSLGDPIVNIDFGTGLPTISQKTYSYLTNYQYVAGSVEDGQYSIKNSTVGDHASGWWQVGDHTGGGYMMVVNASYSPGEFYRDTISGLCPGTTYEFAAWVLNLLKSDGIKPNITFTIQTSQATKTFNTGDLANRDPDWHQHGTFFTTPTGSGTVIIIMTNNAPGGGGNDIAIDDITFRACGPIVTTKFEVTNDATVNACEGDNIAYNMVGVRPTGYTDPAYQWQQNTAGAWQDIPGATTLSYRVTIPSAAAGTYNYRVVTAERPAIGSVNCRVASNTLTIKVNSPPANAIIGPDVVCEGLPISFSSTSGDTYSWTGPNGFRWYQQTITLDAAKLSDAGKYTVVVTRNGCSTTIVQNLKVTPKVVAKATANTTICIGDALQLQASGGNIYLWTPAAGLSNPLIANPIAKPTVTTRYAVQVTGTIGGCFDTTSVLVTVDQHPVVNAGKDVTIHEGQSVVLNGSATGKTWYWTPSTALSSDTSLHAVASPTETTTYTLHSTSGAPCNFETTDEVTIHVYQKVIIPNTFTPNNDGVNDIWNIRALNTYPTADTQVFTRDGQKVFQSTAYAKPWDGTFAGKPLPAAVYYYKIDLKNGEILAGWVTVIR